MARTAERNNIWVRPFTANIISKRLHVEDAYVCVDEEDRKDGIAMSIVHCITENVQDKAKAAVQLVECDMELREEYKQLLVQAVAERTKRKFSDVEMWKEIEKETGFNHKIVWDEIREVTIKKIMSLLPAEDLVENISKEMQLSPTDWLLFDLILVHEQINVLNIDPLILPHDPTLPDQGNTRSDLEEPRCLQELFELVKQFDIEHLCGEVLAESWTRLTLQYNSRGRQVSPMLLQLRWYHMKEMTRSRFYNSYVYNKTQDTPKKTQSNEMHELTVLQNAIAVAYNKILTEEYPTWETLIEQERVILYEQFKLINLGQYENKTDSSQAAIPSNRIPDTLIKVDEKQMRKIRKSVGNIINEDAIHFDLKNDVIDNKALEERYEQFKIRLIKEVVKEKGLRENIAWYRLRKIFKRECKDIWYQMRNATVKKITNLLALDDVINHDESNRMQLSDWLLFDLILVHEKIIVFDYDKLESRCLCDLVKLVQEHDVENCLRENLAEAWINLTLKYNIGGRQCSPMLLQLRWHQLKQMSRQQIYKPSLLLNRNKTKILRAIVAKYQKIITQRWLDWRTLIQNKSVVLPEEFITAIQQKKKWTRLEPREGWYLYVKEVIGHYDTVEEIKDTADNVICIVPDKLQSDNVDKFNGILEQMPKQLTLSKLNETKEPEIVELDSDDEINEILREKADYLLNTSQEKIKNILNMPNIIPGSDLGIELPKTIRTENLTGNEADDFAKSNNSNIYRMEVEESGIIKKESIMADKEYEALDEADLDENNIELVDDGIEFEEACEYNTSKNELKTVFSSCSDGNSNSEDGEDENQIDLKLLMNTTVETKRIDCMEVFKFIDYNYVNDKRVIEYVESKSKPFKPTTKQKDIERFREQAIPRYEKYANEFDEYKTLAKKLINETMCSRRHDLKRAQANEMENTDHRIVTITVPSIPDVLTEDQNTKLAKHVKDLIATMSADDHEGSDVTSNVIPSLAAKRSKVINLPDKEQIRLLNQSLLTAEITPRHQPTLNLPAVNTKNSNKNEAVRSIYPADISPRKRFKTDLETSQPGLPNDSYYCCWARQKIVHTDQNLHLECSEHTCRDNHCTCCCRFELASYLQNTNMTSTKCPILPKVAVTKSRNVNYIPSVNANTLVKTKINCDKSGGFSKPSDLLVPINTQNTVNVTNASFAPTITSLRIPVKNSTIERGSKLDKPPKSVPQKVLNYTIDSNTSLLRKTVSPSTKASTSNDKISATNTPEFVKIAPRLPANQPQTSDSNVVVVPPGVNFVKIDGKLALAINPGVKLQPADLHSLMSVCAMANYNQ